jgi:hypothetical protein
VLVAGLWVVLLGTGLIIVTLVTLAMRWHGLLLIRRLRAAPRLTCAELARPGRLPRQALVRGTTAPGPAGTFTSPGHRVPCLWYRFAVTELAGGEPSAGDAFRPSATALARRAESGPVAVADHTGSVLLDVDLAINHVSGRGIIAELLDDGALPRAGLRWQARSGPAGSGSPLGNLERAGLLPARARGLVLRKTLLLREQVITAGQPVTVLARPRRRGGQVLLGGRGVLSSADPDAWLATLADDTRSSAALLKFLPIGAVVGAAGVVLIVLGAS